MITQLRKLRRIKFISVSGHHLKKKSSLHKWTLLLLFIFSVLALLLLMNGIQAFPYYQYQPDSQLQSELQDILNNRNPREEWHYSLRNAWVNLSQSNYEELTIEERLAIAELIADFEAGQLGIPSLKVKATRLEEGIASLYNSNSRTVVISYSVLEQTDPELLVESVAHEMFHSGQSFCVDSIDWSLPITKTWYFKELSEWKSNLDAYISTSDGYSYDQYALQPVEMSARAFSLKEKDQIFLHVHMEGDRK